MSQFLAPIHTWLFDKILILESIEKALLRTYDDEKLVTYHIELMKKIGPMIPDAPIEDIIELSNIHGWLQNTINKTESRQAALIAYLLNQKITTTEAIETIYYNVGSGLAQTSEATLEIPGDVYKALNDVLLEGMPCDRVNNVIEQSEGLFKWQTVQCVHKNNWESQQVNVEMFYGLRAALTKGFVEASNQDLEYSYSNSNGQLHQIMKKIGA